MKKNLLLLKGYLVIMCLIFCPFFVYAGGNVNDNNIPKKINLQGRYTKSYGDPVTNTPITVKYQFLDNSGWGSLKEISTTTDSEGLYNLNLDVNLSSQMEISKFSSTVQSMIQDGNTWQNTIALEAYEELTADSKVVYIYTGSAWFLSSSAAPG